MISRIGKLVGGGFNLSTVYAVWSGTQVENCLVLYLLVKFLYDTSDAK